MAKNDIVLLDSILEQRLADGLPSSSKDEVFEYFVLEQVLKDFDLSREELESGWIDGRDDGGIDAFFIFVNGRLLQDPATFAWPKAGALLEIVVFTCKHHATFEQAPLNSILASAQELFDLSLSSDRLKGSYSEELLEMRAALMTAYRRLSMAKAEMKVRFCYGSRGDSTEVGSSVAARADQLQNLVGSFFSSCAVQFEFIGAKELVGLFRRAKQFSLELPFIEHVSAGGGSYVLLVRLDDYCRFVSDDTENLRRYLFDSNVRDFLGGSSVNQDIGESLKTKSAPDFWWLNNGVTILATNAALSGKAIALENIQIVNGLQTTETIYQHFRAGHVREDARTLLVKVLVSIDPLVRDRIIRATNNQNAVDLASLHATDRIQRDIEDILEKHDWYYERRRNYYRNIGKPAQRFVTPLYLASCLVALVLKNPRAASRLKTRFMRSAQGYASVFSEEVPIQIWPAIVEISKRVDEELLSVRPRAGELGDKFLGKWRPLVSLICVARVLGTFDYAYRDLISLNPEATSRPLVREVWQEIRNTSEQPKPRAYRSHTFVLDRCQVAATAHGLAGVACVNRRQVAGGVATPPDEGFLQSVNNLLVQAGVESDTVGFIATQLKCKRSRVKSAFHLLRRRGISVPGKPALPQNSAE